MYYFDKNIGKLKKTRFDIINGIVFLTFCVPAPRSFYVFKLIRDGIVESQRNIDKARNAAIKAFLCEVHLGIRRDCEPLRSLCT